VSSFPTAYADAYCHFIYHCCTASDRASGGAGNPASDFIFTAEQDGFDDESSCDAKLAPILQSQSQVNQASVKSNRMTYNQATAQTCLNVISTVTSACDPASFNAALVDGGACDGNSLFTGAVPGGGVCTQAADCAAKYSLCAPEPDDGGVEIVASTGLCVSPPAVGKPCEGVCAQGSCCNGTLCVAYAAEGAACDGPSCGTAPCDPSVDYCLTSLSTGMATCTPLIPNGSACTPSLGGADCQSGLCGADGGLCVSLASLEPPTKIEVCIGNPNGG
jgi:hypothetical protein